VTWGFLFLASLLVGLVLAAVFGVLETLPKHREVALPRPELARHRRQVHVAHLGAGLAGFGAVGLVLVAWGRWPIPWILLAALAAAFLAWLLAHLAVGLPCALGASGGEAVVVREIPPGGYGQVSIRTPRGETVFAAQSEGAEPIAAGSRVQVVDCQRSVVVVRKLGDT